jgi:hypothetical protein
MAMKAKTAAIKGSVDTFTPAEEKWFKDWFAARGVADFHLDDLFGTCRTSLARLGVEPHIAERVLNNAQNRIPSTYDRHAYLDQKRAALEKRAAQLRALVKGTG